MTDLGLLVLRLAFGLGMGWHGFTKVFGGMDEFTGLLEAESFPLPELFAWVAALVELGCGALVAIGFLTRQAALLLIANLLVAILWVHWGQPFIGGWELPLLYLAGLLAIAAAGPGKASVDAMSGRAA